MYFINFTRDKLTSSNFLMHILPAGAVLVTMLALTLLSWRNAQQAYESERQAAINTIVTENKNSISERLESYRLVLIGASGLFVSSNDVDRDEWRRFIRSFDIPENYPGVQGLGYMQTASRSDIPDIIKSIEKDGYDNVKLHPTTDTGEYAITKYMVPAHEPGLGYNMLSHPSRKDAIQESKRTGSATISDRVMYTKTEMPFSGVGFSMYLPVNASAREQDSPPENRKIQGYVFAPFLADEFFDIALENNNKENHALKIYDASKEPDNLLYETDNFASMDNDNSSHFSDNIEIFGQSWTIDYRISPDIISRTTQNRPLTALIAGILMSILLSGFVLSLLIARSRVLSHSKQAEIQSAKDELLSLASHQLRTPATSVKQYIGMILEGFAGKVPSQQKTLLDKAYESNERQLHIINEILYVAKIDAKGIVLTPRRFNLNKVLRSLTQELSITAKKNNQKIRLQMPKTQTYIEADEHSLRMSIENLINNALKYSHEGTTTTVKMSSSNDHVEITVKDRGVGIDQSELPLLFQRFSRIPNELSMQSSGSGIGLYLSQQLVEMHGGTIDVESIKNKGTTFTIKLPKKYTPKSDLTDNN